MYDIGGSPGLGTISGIISCPGYFIHSVRDISVVPVEILSVRLAGIDCLSLVHASGISITKTFKK